MHLKQDARLGPYQILAPIGAGGMGEVYKARDTRLGRDVAVKVLPAEFASDPERLRRFEQEARAAAALNHPNILVLYDIGTHDGAPYIVTELLEGETVRDRLRGGPIPQAKAVDMGVQMAQGLSAAHEKGIVHRDLKPENLFVTKGGHLKILDFGLAQLRPQGLMPQDFQTGAPTADSPTREGRVLGTPGYMSPEQARGLVTDHRSDVFSFGCVLYEMLSGKRAFTGATFTDVMAAILKEDPPPLPKNVLPGIDRVVRQCLEKLAEDRFQSAHDLALALQASSGTSPSGGASPVLSAARGWARQHRIATGAMCAILLAAALAGILSRHPWKANPSPAATATALAPTLVALPCKVLGSPESAYLTDAIPNTLSTLLGEVQGMETKVPPTSFEVEKVHGDLDKIAEAYGVQTFVLSTATAEGDHLIFNIQLADARTRKVRWSHEYRGSRENYTAMAHEAAQGICKAMLPEAAVMVRASGASSNSEGELAYQRGRYYGSRFWYHRDGADFDRALEAYNRALELNPKDALTAAFVGGLYLGAQAIGRIPRAQGLETVEAWVQKALALDPQCSQAWAVRANLESERPDADMEHQIEWSLKAAQLGPKTSGGASTLAVHGLLTGGLLMPGVEALREALRQNPLDFMSYTSLAYALTALGRPEEALSAVDTVLSLDPGNQWALACKSNVLAETGRAKEAATLLKYLEASGPSGDLGLFVQDAKWLVSLAVGDERDAHSSLKAIMAHFADPASVWNLLQNEIDLLLPAVNRRFGKHAALDLLVLSTKRGGTMPYDMLMLRPDLQEIREDPRAKDVIQKTKVPFDLLIRILRDASARGECPKYIEKPMDDLLKELQTKGAWP